jgi:hypothetical protein
MVPTSAHTVPQSVRPKRDWLHPGQKLFRDPFLSVRGREWSGCLEMRKSRSAVRIVVAHHAARSPARGDGPLAPLA